MKKESLKLHGKNCVYIKSPCNIKKNHVVPACAFPNCQGSLLFYLFLLKGQEQDMKMLSKPFKRRSND